MRKIVFFVLFSIISFSLMSQSVDVINKELSYLHGSESQIARVNNLTLVRDVATITMKSGELYKLSSVNERTVAAIYYGDYNIKISPLHEIDRERMKSRYDVEEYDMNHNVLFLLFTDSTLVQLEENLVFKNDIFENPAKEIEYCLQFLYDSDYNSYNTHLLRTILNEELDGYFYAHCFDELHHQKAVFFEIDPSNDTEVAIYSRIMGVKSSDAVTNVLGEMKLRKILVSRFNLKEELFSGILDNRNEEDLVTVERVTIKAEMDKHLDLKSKCKIDFTANRETGKWLDLVYYDKLEIESITDGKGEELFYSVIEDNPVLWVNLSESLSEQERCCLTIKYGGVLVEHGGTIVRLGSYDLWYPQFITSDFNDFDITLTYPRKYKLASVGEKVFSEKSGKFMTERWVTENPVNYAPVNIGKFKTDQFSKEGFPELDFYMSADLKSAKADVVNCVNFYQEAYGNCSYEALTVSDIPVILSGEAYPGLVNFYNNESLKNPIIGTAIGRDGNMYDYWADFDISSADFMQLRAHEVSHQWWGCGVKCGDFQHDRWLFEGLAEFSSIWFLQTSLQENRKYFEFLDEWKLKILSGYSMKRTDKQTDIPPWMSYCAPSYIVYAKGGWIFHMLRNLMMDLNTFDESSFKTMMQDFYSTYKGKEAGTFEFQKCVEKHIGMDMNWFFEQWVYGNQIPRLDYDYEIEEKEDGNIYAICKITQEDVDEDFRSYIPIEFNFGNNRVARIRKKAEGSYSEFEIKLPGRPERVDFNVFNSVLDNDM